MTEQGGRQQNKLKRLFIHMLLLFFLQLPQHALAETFIANVSAHEKTAQHHIFIFYSPDNILHASIIQKLTTQLSHIRSDIIISKITAGSKIKNINNGNDIIISIGAAGIANVEKNYPNTRKLFIITTPYKYQSATNKNTSTLYMTQSYCRQMNFITQLNTSWETIGIISSHEKPVNTALLEQCANKYKVKVHVVNTTKKDNKSNKIKEVLNHSDVLLALPDSSIYNSKTVKNILLTSYRYRKPVIAFSKNFVVAGALAAIHSNIDQIIQSASKLVEQQLDSNTALPSATYYPESFELSTNRQVFKALDITMPDIEKLKTSLNHNAGESR